MALVPLGAVTTMAGHPKQITTDKMYYNAIVFEVLDTNTGKIWVGLKNMDKSVAAKTGVIGWLPPPTANTAGSITIATTFLTNLLRADELYVDVDIDGEGALVSVLQQ